MERIPDVCDHESDQNLCPLLKDPEVGIMVNMLADSPDMHTTLKRDVHQGECAGY